MLDEKDKSAAYKYINDFQNKTYDRITILRSKGDKQALTKISSDKGFRTLTEFINSCIDEKLKRMKIDINDFREKETNKDPE